MLLITVGPLLFMFTAFTVAGHGPTAGETTGAPASDPRLGRRDRAALHVAVDGGLELHDPTRGGGGGDRAPALRARERRLGSAIESAGAPDELDLFSFPFVVADLSFRIFGETPEDDGPVESLSTVAAAGGVVAAIAAGFLVRWLRYRRLEAFR